MSKRFKLTWRGKLKSLSLRQSDQFEADEDHEKLKRVLESTVPGKLNAIENLIEQITETMIDADKRDEDVSGWITRTRDSFAVEQHRRRLQENMK